MFYCKFILHHVVNRAESTSHSKKFASVAGWPLPVPPDPLPVPDFASLSQAGPALAGRPQCSRTSPAKSGLAGRPRALLIRNRTKSAPYNKKGI